MKKIIFILSLFFYAQPILADILFNDPANCVVDTSGQNTFYICSGDLSQGDSCAGKKFRPSFGHSRVWAKKGDTFSFNGETYLCNGVVFQLLGVAGILFNDPATCVVNYVGTTDVFYICSGTVDTNNLCAGLNYNPDMGDRKIQINAGSMRNFRDFNYICKDGIFQKSVSGASGYLWGTNNWCVVEDKTGKKNFYLCGDDGSGTDLECHRKKYGKLLGRDIRNFYRNNDEVTIANYSYTCCIETGKNTGSFKDTTAYVDVQATANVDNGTCTYTQKKNVCGNIVDEGTKCTVPTKCNDGYKLKDNKCVSISAPSSTSTQQSGSATSGASSGSAQQSSSGASVSSGASGSSVSSGPSEPEIIEVTREDMEKCWFCRKKEAFLGCMKSKGNPVNSAYRKDCKLD